MKDVVRIYVKDLFVLDYLLFECEVYVDIIDFIDVVLCLKFMELFINIFDLCLLFGWY